MNTPLPLAAGGRDVPDAVDNVRRYVGLEWSGGPPEVWAFQYFDRVPAEQDDVITPIDVLAASALHPGLSRDDMAFFVDHAAGLSRWLSQVDPEDALWNLDERQLDHLDTLADVAGQASITLLTKVIHRKRPRSVPLLDRHLIDWYRPVTGERRPVTAWPKVLRAIRDDLGTPEERLLVIVACSQATEGLEPLVEISPVRFIDIAIWMASR